MKFSKTASRLLLTSFALSAAACQSAAPTPAKTAYETLPLAPDLPPSGVLPLRSENTAEAAPPEAQATPESEAAAPEGEPVMRLRQVNQTETAMVRDGSHMAVRQCESRIIQSRDPATGVMLFDRRTETCEIQATDPEIADKLNNTSQRLEESGSTPKPVRPPAKGLLIQAKSSGMSL